MKRRSWSTLAVIVPLTAHVVAFQNPASPVATPILSHSDRLPTFLLECRNETAKPIFAGNEMRLDGTPFESNGVVGGAIPRPMPPGASWREIVTLYDTPNVAGRSGRLDAVLSTLRPVTLDPGRHRVAFRCGGAWSNDVWFFWDGRPAPTTIPQPFSIQIARRNQCGAGFNDPTNLNQCPTYGVSIDGNGLVTYEGTAGVTTIGTRQHMIGSQALQQLIDAIEQAGFFEMAARYDKITVAGSTVSIDHSVATTLTVALGDRRKSVYDFWGAPDALRVLEQQIDEIAGIPRLSGRSDLRLHRRTGVLTAAIATADARLACPAIFSAAVAQLPVDASKPDVEPRFKQFVEPDYPARWREIEVTGEALLVVSIAADGSVTRATVCAPSGILDEEAIAAARRWTFVSAAQPMVVGVRVHFRVR